MKLGTWMMEAINIIGNEDDSRNEAGKCEG